MKKSLLFISTLFAAGTLAASAATILGTETYAGTIYTFSSNVSGQGLASASYLTGVDTTTNPKTYDTLVEYVSGSTTPTATLFSDSSGTSASLNTLRFIASQTELTKTGSTTTVTTSSVGQINLNVANLALGGLIIDSGLVSTWSLVNTAGSADYANVYLGSSNSTFVGTIGSNFELCPSQGSGYYSSGTIHFYGTQNWTITEQKTLKLSGNWDVDSNANISFSGGSTTMSGNGATATIAGTLNISNNSLELWHLVGAGTINIGANSIFNVGSLGKDSKTWTGAIALNDSTAVLNLPSISATTTYNNITGTGTINITNTGGHVGVKFLDSTTSAASNFKGTLVWTGKFNPNQTTLNSGATLELHSAATSTSMWSGANKEIAYKVHFATDFRIGDTDKTGVITFSNKTSATNDVSLLIGGSGSDVSKISSVKFASELDFANATISSVANTVLTNAAIYSAGTIEFATGSSGTVKTFLSGGTTKITGGSVEFGNITVSAGTLEISAQNISAGTVSLTSASSLIVSDSLIADLGANESTVLMLICGNTSLTVGSDAVDSSNVNSLLADVSLGDAFDAYDTSWKYSNNTLSLVVSSIPEPSMFGLLAGTLALGLAGTRRRRAK